MGKIYITGHRNPDIDSLCAASAYANLKNLTDSGNEYVAIHCSPVSDQVREQMETMTSCSSRRATSRPARRSLPW